MKIYTKSGDRGKTSLFSGDRVSKSHRRVEAYGAVDELCSVLGWAGAVLPESAGDMRNELEAIQADLFDVGAWLAVREASPLRDSLVEIGADRVVCLERSIDRMEAALPTLRTFILPGGHPAGAAVHVARTVCRRAERKVVGLTERAGPDGDGGQHLERILAYLNRLSDYLFVAARFVNRSAGAEEIPWRG